MLLFTEIVDQAGSKEPWGDIEYIIKEPSHKIARTAAEKPSKRPLFIWRKRVGNNMSDTKSKCSPTFTHRNNSNETDRGNVGIN